MSHRYLPHTPEDITAMLDCCGLKSLDDLYSDVPEQLRFHRDYDLPSEMSEKEVRDFFDALGRKNSDLVCFAGNGFYDHDAPAAVKSLIARSEYLTAYTPYQPEISQGTLQYIFEYQSIICRLTDMDVSNASMYDGGTATAESMMMAVAHARKRNKVLVSATIHAVTREIIDTYALYHGVEVVTVPEKNGTTDKAEFEALVAADDVAGVIVPLRNKYGVIECYEGWADVCHAHKSLLIMNCIASDLAVVKTPGEWGADVAVGDAQSLGIPLGYGGPYLGFMAVKKPLMRKIPGRIVGATKDADGRRVFVLTLQAREQHIRREKATSNICSNQGLMSLYVTIYTALNGVAGLREINRQGINGAHYLADKIVETGKATLAFPEAIYLNEFTLTTTVPAQKIIDEALCHGILAGVAIAEHQLLIAVTEMQTVAQMDKLVEIIKSL